MLAKSYIIWALQKQMIYGHQSMVLSEISRQRIKTWVINDIFVSVHPIFFLKENVVGIACNCEVDPGSS